MEDKVKDHMQKQAMGAPTRDSMRVAEVYQRLMENQGGYVQGLGSDAFVKIADAIVKMLTEK